MKTGNLLRLAASAALLSCLCAAGPDAAAQRTARRPQTPRPAATAAVPFRPACDSPSYPQPAPSAPPAIDSLCGIYGDGSGPEGMQDSVKNNFCASGTPRAMTFDDLTNLQKQVEANPKINFGSGAQNGRAKGPTIDRGPLKDLGEGQLVTLHAYVLRARQEGPESVNCKKTVSPQTTAYHDIHISLVAAPDVQSECAGVVAEMSPHHRPDSWTAGHVGQVAAAKLPVRVTGQLFFDSSHFPCAGGKPVGKNPSRVSLWEIHPVYKFEVCTSGGTCASGGTWVPLDQWVAAR